MNDFFKLPFSFNIENLLKDFNICNQTTFIPHFNTNNYSGKWNSISLRSLNGDSTNIYAHKTENATYKNCKILKDCTYFQYIIDQFHCDKEAIRLLNLAPNSKIKSHKDDSLSYEDGFFRIHIPIKTNSKVLFHINNKPLQMLAGEVWYANFNLLHKVENLGKTDRVHLVMDCVRNEWSDELFKKAGYNFSTETNKSVDKETLLRTIEELKILDTDTSKALILSLKRQLNSCKNQ